ncbi:hypothetical protein FisN_13Hh225 [Fistulifera solaris]|uniref:HOOK N-terminal domain-containing protein n=1 Tax=Fistulifera solaris TaxID=1519565 RepID=A0A1Z5KMW1_FISSO|nr:hypothetical protein FisN_13Hh225 [Fistulifera solaris]|eukprot:GAX27680.1 hypothetical protein FisN_13Hh225 [Fistulifera solaris]
MGDEQRNLAMIEFLASFSTVSQSPADILELSDGVVVFEALSEIAPSYFDPTTIARHLGENWVLKSSNIRKLVRNLQQFFQEDLKKTADFAAIDQTKIAREADADAVASLVELVAAAAVTCSSKGDYIQRIMQMSPEGQLAMKGVIESSLQRVSDYTTEDQYDDESELVFGGDNDGTEEAVGEDQLFGRNNAYDADELEEQLESAKKQITILKSQAAVAEEEGEKAQKKLRALVEDLQDRLDKRQEELSDLEQELQRTVTELNDTKAALATAQEEKAHLADDLDVANAKAGQLHKAEAALAAYKKKLDGAGTKTQQVSELEEQASKYLQQIVELENEVKKSNTLQKTVAELQEKIATLEDHRSHTESSTKSSEEVIEKLKSQLSAAESAKKMYQTELDELRAKQESLAALESSAPIPVPVPTGPSPEEKEKYMRLEIENKQLQEEVAQLTAAAETAAAASALAAVSLNETNESAIESMKEEIEALKTQLEQKEKENEKIVSDKERLEAYTKKTLSKFQDKYLVALQDCKTKLKEKQDKIESLEQRSVSERAAQKREERLLSSTIYELGLAIMQNKLKGGS